MRSRCGIKTPSDESTGISSQLDKRVYTTTMNSVIFVLGAVVAFSSAAHVKRDVVVAPFASQYVASAPLVSSQYVAPAPLVSSQYFGASPYVSQYVAASPYVSQYVASPVVSSAYVAAPNPVLARASRVLGEPGFVSRYVAAPVVAAPVAAAPVAAAPVAAVDTIETVAAPAKIVAPTTVVA
ncbi:hypothetical protein GE061_005904 [Apolygus lucorum]|uniref:Uncharacterized protein n=1 Tax=Apolygus lucorum TaxID=248454 RepID=A0A8S9WUU7_APOLU|nr:hypothetical protein GE061_005904 [Apolygus lucorum]